MVIRGENLRLFVSGLPVAADQSCTVHIAAQVEDVSSKDSGKWVENKVFAVNWDLQADSLVTNSTRDDVSADYFVLKVGARVKVSFSSAGGNMNRDAGENVIEGEAIVTDVQITAANKKMGTMTVKLTGDGELYAYRKLEDAYGGRILDRDGKILMVE